MVTRNNRWLVVSVLVLTLLVLGACGKNKDKKEKVLYNQITMDQAKKMIKVDDGHVIVDVREQKEYDEGHIPKAINIPSDSIGTEKPSQLPDTDQVILIYCRSGKKSKEVAMKLYKMGYTNIYEFEAFIDWDGEIEKTVK